MTKPNVASWDQVANNNADVGGINITGNGLVSTADNSFREILSEVAKLYADLGGVNTVAGTGDVITITTASVFTALATGLVLAFKAGAANTTNVTVNVDGLGAKAVRKFTTAEVALAANDIITGGKYLMVYDAAANSAAGAWVLLNPAPSTAAASASIATVASAATTLIGAAASAEVNITGTTTITAFDTVAAGTVREGYFSGILTLTHNGTSLILPGGVSITTAANDRFKAVSLGSGNWLVYWYQFADGTELVEQGISTIASATTTAIAAAGTYREVSITGTTTITGFGTVKAGVRRKGVFTGILTLTYNASSLILPGAANITTAAGDTFEAVSLGSGNWRVTSYIKGDGTPLAGGGQPIPSSSTFAVGTLIFAWNTSAGTIADGSTCAGSALNRVSGNNPSNTPTITNAGGALTGTWKNVSGISVPNLNLGYWVRTA